MFINNIFSTYRPVIGAYPDEEPELLGPFDYNWVGGVLPYAVPVWFGSNNHIRNGVYLDPLTAWDPDEWPTETLLLENGIDVSQPFLLRGVQYPALPGMEQGYFVGQSPDIGAVQFNRP